MTNPYQTPKADVDTNQVHRENELASRWQRLGGAIIDSIIGFLVGIPIMLWLGLLDYIKAGIKPPFQYSLLATLYGFLAFIVIHSYFLKTSGQTIGKKMVGIKIVNLEGALLDLKTILFKRYFPIVVISLIPLLGQLLSLIDILFIFGQNKRCVHDYIAGSKVVVSS